MVDTSCKCWLVEPTHAICEDKRACLMNIIITNELLFMQLMYRYVACLCGLCNVFVCLTQGHTWLECRMFKLPSAIF